MKLPNWMGYSRTMVITVATCIFSITTTSYGDFDWRMWQIEQRQQQLEQDQDDLLWEVDRSNRQTQELLKNQRQVLKNQREIKNTQMIQLSIQQQQLLLQQQKAEQEKREREAAEEAERRKQEYEAKEKRRRAYEAEQLRIAEEKENEKKLQRFRIDRATIQNLADRELMLTSGNEYLLAEKMDNWHAGDRIEVFAVAGQLFLRNERDMTYTTASVKNGQR